MIVGFIATYAISVLSESVIFTAGFGFFSFDFFFFDFFFFFLAEVFLLTD
jgi:hypothetical protein